MSRSNPDPHIAPEEWRWVILASGLLAALTLLPYAGALASNAGTTEAQFMGLLANPTDGMSYLAKMEQGYRGEWLFHLPYTPEPHDGAAINLFYLFLGHVARITGLSLLLVYHLARVAAGLFMYCALYQFGATVWTRLRPRRLFFGLTAVASGLGWLIIALDQGAIDPQANRLLPDLNMPEAFPLYSLYANPHFPLSIGLLALVGSIYVGVFRPGYREEPTLYNQGLILALASVVLSIAQPQALVPLAVALAAYLVVRLVRTHRAPLYEASWCVPLWFPAAPFLAYYFAITQVNPAMAAWNAQNVTPSPPLQYYLAAFGPLLVVALPGLGRAVRRFEPYGDQFMLTWLLVNAVLLYVPINLQRRLVIGLIIPIVYFAVRALEDYWSNVISGRLWRPALMALFVIVLPSNLFALVVPLVGAVFSPERGLEANLLIENDYRDMLQWVHDSVPLQTDRHPTVFVASPDVSLFIPPWGGPRVVYGHPYETINAAWKRTTVLDWYDGEDCERLLNGAWWQGQSWQVDYVVLGPRERALGESDHADACYADLGEPLMTFGDVAVYKVR
jgi:hypothetical protein